MKIIDNYDDTKYFINYITYNNYESTQPLELLSSFCWLAISIAVVSSGVISLGNWVSTILSIWTVCSVVAVVVVKVASSFCCACRCSIITGWYWWIMGVIEAKKWIYPGLQGEI